MSKVLKTPSLDLKTYTSVFGENQIIVEAETTEEAQKKIELKIQELNETKEIKNI